MSLKVITELAIPAVFFCFMSIIILSLINANLKKIAEELHKLNGKETEQDVKEINVSKLTRK